MCGEGGGGRCFRFAKKRGSYGLCDTLKFCMKIKLRDSKCWVGLGYTRLVSEKLYPVYFLLQGEHVKLVVDGKVVLHVQVGNASKHGFAGYGTMGYGFADFDNLHIMKAMR